MESRNTRKELPQLDLVLDANVHDRHLEDVEALSDSGNPFLALYRYEVSRSLICYLTCPSGHAQSCPSFPHFVFSLSFS